MRSLVDTLLRRLAPQDGGNVLIEFALALPVLCLMMVGGFDLGRYALQKSAITEGARAGAQYGIFAYQGASSSDPATSAAINTTAQNATGLSGVTATNTFFCECTAGTTVSCSTATCSTLKKYITVSMSKSYSPIVGSVDFGAFGSWTPPTSMSASVTMIVPQ
jgi:Flp pilus assembly protein TadG